MDFKSKIIGTFTVEKQAEAFKNLVHELYGVHCEIRGAEIHSWTTESGERHVQRGWCVRSPEGKKLLFIKNISKAFGAGLTWDM
jgi:hypothetical protein